MSARYKAFARSNKMESLYRIYWSTSTGVKGNGTVCLDLKIATAWINQLNTEHPDVSHWIVQCKEST
jgi:hypothetical protein